VTDSELCQSTDARVWAEAFQIASLGRHVNLETLTRWFANAIEAGRNAGAKPPASGSRWFHCQGTRSEKVFRTVEAVTPSEAAQKYYEATGVVPSLVDEHVTVGRCTEQTCRKFLFVDLPYCMDEGNRHWCTDHNPYRRPNA